MRKSVSVLLAITVLVVFSTIGVSYAETLDDAKALVDKAAAFWKANGKDKAIAELNNPKGQFVKGGLFVVSQDFKGVVLANPMNSALIGQNHFQMKDPNGKFFVKEQIEAAKKGSGTVEFQMTNPVTKKIANKIQYVKKIEGEDCFVAGGVYK